jgi:hypothetical protein
MKKFNGFERWVLTEALTTWCDQFEAQVLADEADGHNSLFAPGYATLITKDLLDKVNDNTAKAKLNLKKS